MTGSTGGLSLAVEERLGIRAEEDALEKLRSYLRKIYGSESPEALEKAFVSGEAASFLTVNETYFFREEAHFRILLKWLPGFGGCLRICSAAASTGCEAYSIAALIENYNKHPADRPVLYHIDAFDINPKVILTAERGVYGERSFRDDGNCFHYLLDPYREKRGAEYRIAPVLKKNIRFFVHNIMDELPCAAYDLVFFRNAFIYFSPRSRDRVLSGLAGSLAAGGYLIMGVSETAGARHPALEDENQDDVFYFRKAPVYRSGISL